MPSKTPPQAHHLDRHAEALARGTAELPADLLLDPQAAARDVLLVGKSFLAQRRVEGNGPRYTRVGRLIRYRVSDLREWLEERAHRCTSEYRKPEPSALGRNGGPPLDDHAARKVLPRRARKAKAKPKRDRRRRGR